MLRPTFSREISTSNNLCVGLFYLLPWEPVFGEPLASSELFRLSGDMPQYNGIGNHYNTYTYIYAYTYNH
jgi:hypothetical protein